ncbi:MAG: beta-propeller fold lactonase family protein [Gallionella sp.]
MRFVLPFAVLLLTACAGNNSYTIGGTVTGLTGNGGPQSVVLQDNGGDSLTVSANGPFTFATALTSNATTSATYNVTILTQPIGQTCTVTGGSGTATSNVTTVVVTCSGTSSSNYAYVVNAGGTVSQYNIGTNGVLNTLASPVSAGTTPYSIAVVASGTYAGLYAYVANYGSNNVSEYTISSGVLTPNTAETPTATIAAGSNPFSVTVDPSGEYVYVVNSGTNPGTISQYSINSDGTLTTLGSTAPQTGTTPYSIAVDPVGPYAYVVNYGDGTISEYTISGGVLSLTATLPAPVSGNNNPASITVDPSGSYVYVANYSSGASTGTVSEYSIGTGGALTPIGSVTAGSNPISVTVSGSSYVYVANYSSGASTGTVSEYSIGTGGALITPTTVATGKNPSSVTVDPSGQYAYVANLGDGTVSQYTISSGVLTANTTAATVTVGGQPIAVITAQ